MNICTLSRRAFTSRLASGRSSVPPTASALAVAVLAVAALLVTGCGGRLEVRPRGSATSTPGLSGARPDDLAARPTAAVEAPRAAAVDRGALVRAYEEAIVAAVEKASATVVSVGREGGQGSGFIVDPSGFILTNFHVISGAQLISVRLPDGRSFRGRIINGDPTVDLALIKIDAADLPTAEFGDSSQVRAGQTAIAIGNPLGLARTVTTGVVSAINREVPETGRRGERLTMVQTSAAINPGNSGGPLVDIEGRVIGVNTLAIVNPSIGGKAEGIGFAVPVNTAKRLFDDWRRGVDPSAAAARPQAFIGISTLTIDATTARVYRLPRGAIVMEVIPSSPAEEAGIRERDVVVRIDGTPLQSGEQLTDALRGKRPGERLRLTLWREGREAQVDVTLGG